eukprot:586368-Pelagomonas_calceolata.AAC.2
MDLRHAMPSPGMLGHHTGQGVTKKAWELSFLCLHADMPGKPLSDDSQYLHQTCAAESLDVLVRMKSETQLESKIPLSEK